MNDSRPTPPVDLGIYTRPVGSGGLDPADKVAIAVSAAWIALCLLFLIFVGLGGEGDGLGGLRFLILMLAVFLPIALIWIAAISLKGARIMREESERLQAAMDAIRQLYISEAQTRSASSTTDLARKIDEIAQNQRRAETALATFVSSRETAPAPPPERPVTVKSDKAAPPPRAEQPGLDLDPPGGQPGRPVSTGDFITALNFPETADDREGFAALRRALADRRAARLVQASQDILTLLSQDGIYMDDLPPDLARPEIWRRFAAGERGRMVSGLGGIRDRSSLALSAGRMRTDSIFRDTAHHFLRTFDRTFAEIADGLTDEEIVRLADTRTARAFMLLGRVAGIFD